MHPAEPPGSAVPGSAVPGLAPGRGPGRLGGRLSGEGGRLSDDKGPPSPILRAWDPSKTSTKT